MRVFLKLALVLISILLLAALGFSAWMLLKFEEKTIRAGEAYGFVVGESSDHVYAHALALRNAGEIAEIRRGTGQGARVLEEHDLQSALADDAWTLVVNPNWWNDSITLRFGERRLVEIYRIRVWGEMP